MRCSVFVAAATLVAQSFATYAPVPTTCPETPLVRSAAGGLSESEERYRVARKINADMYLASWLHNANKDFTLTPNNRLPTIALTSSGGGFRATLSGAGTVKALDHRETPRSGASGLYQTLSYHSAVSGGSWLLSSIIATNYSQISDIYDSNWKTGLANGLFNPLGSKGSKVYASINNDILLKKAKGFPGTIVDAWSRLLSYVILPGANGGMDNLLSQVATMSSFKSAYVPYPIIVAQHVNLKGKSCLPPADAPFWEFTPYEMGSWDHGIASFTPTQYLGTSLSAGKPTGGCIESFENLGYIFGTSSSLFQDPGIGHNVSEPLLSNFCQLNEKTPVSEESADTSARLAQLPSQIPAISSKNVSDLFASWPNPFYNLSSAPLVQDQANLSMVDGGESGQINPIFPMLIPQRNISIIIVSDNTDGNYNYPTGKELRATYLAAEAAGLTKMPFVPESSVLLARNLTSRPVFFGCANHTAATLIWMPNYSATFAGGNTDTSLVKYEEALSAQVIDNGAAVMGQTDDEKWATCLGCAIAEKGEGIGMPPDCKGCFHKYCYNDIGY